MVRQQPERGRTTMDSLPTWTCWIIAGVVLMSPALAFLSAILIEIGVGTVREGGLPALIMLISAGIFSRLLFRKIWKRPQTGTIIRH
jgi:hypothetical protein